MCYWSTSNTVTMTAFLTTRRLFSHYLQFIIKNIIILVPRPAMLSPIPTIFTPRVSWSLCAGIPLILRIWGPVSLAGDGAHISRFWLIWFLWLVSLVSAVDITSVLVLVHGSAALVGLMALIGVVPLVRLVTLVRLVPLALLVSAAVLAVVLVPLPVVTGALVIITVVAPTLFLPGRTVATSVLLVLVGNISAWPRSEGMWSFCNKQN